MKTSTKLWALATFLTAFTGWGNAFGADWVVEENGVSPNFATIQDAVTAASPGDRIFVVNKSGSIPYLENVTIDKAIEILPYTANGNFLVFGNYTISPNGSGFSSTFDSVRIIGMLNQSGSIVAAANNSTGNGIEIDVVSCQLNAGSIIVSGTQFYSRVSGNWLQSGSITVRESMVTGNLVNGSITVNDAAGSMIGSDETLYVVGNRLTSSTGASVSGTIQWSNDDHYFHIANNLVRSSLGGTSGAIRFTSIRNGVENNQLVNNSIETDGAADYGITSGAALASGTRLKIANNALHDLSGSSTEYALFFNPAPSPGALVEINYNVEEGFANGITNVSGAQAVIVGNQTAASTFDIDNVTGVSPSAEAINGGHPGNAYTDHDLSRNDCGVAGGSFNYTNFWPILTGGARVMLVKTPRVALPSSAINAEADAHDR